ncbi:hypothetical protein [Haladaptatus salinisoli]|uniref:hypothetical protein n=1 Tax=Haladaptatus salinisoli TaxID=2884876 RepID=UPI001D0BC3AB|nr:hypothetical protein [Haladaptatus salinisoli]
MTGSPAVAGLAPGDHSVAFRLVNGSGPFPHESAFDAATVTVDVEPPELTVEAGREQVRPGTPLRAIVSDTAISDVSYRTNRSESGSLAVSETLDERRSFYEIDTAGWPAVPTELVVTARDRSGNVRTERVVFDFGGAGGKGREVGADVGGGGGGGRSRTVVQVAPGDDGVAVDLLNGRDGVGRPRRCERERRPVLGVRRHLRPERRQRRGHALRPDAAERLPGGALAALRVEKRYVRTGDVASATLRFSLGADALPSGASPADVALYQRRDGGWRRLAVSREGRNFSATVYDLSTVVVGVERGGADSAASGAGNASTGERGGDGGGTDDRETTETSVGPATATDRPAPTTEGSTPAARDGGRQERRPAGLRISRRARRVDSSRP